MYLRFCWVNYLNLMVSVAPDLIRAHFLSQAKKWMAQASLSAGTRPHLLPGQARHDEACHSAKTYATTGYRVFVAVENQL